MIYRVMANKLSSGEIQSNDETSVETKQKKNVFLTTDESDEEFDSKLYAVESHSNELISGNPLRSVSVESDNNEDSLNITRFDTNELLYQNSQFEEDIYDAEGSSDEGNKSDLLHKEQVSSSSQSSIKKKLDVGDDSGKTVDDEDSKENSCPYYEHNIPENESSSQLSNVISKKSKKKRKVANAVESERDQIHSEAQKLVRQTVVSLPYHVPKQRSLADFLNRRKATPVVPLRTSADNLTKVWKALEDREKTAEEFYQSSDSEAEMVNEDNKHSVDNNKDGVVENCRQAEVELLKSDLENAKVYHSHMEDILAEDNISLEKAVIVNKEGNSESEEETRTAQNSKKIEENMDVRFAELQVKRDETNELNLPEESVDILEMVQPSMARQEKKQEEFEFRLDDMNVTVVGSETTGGDPGYSRFKISAESDSNEKSESHGEGSQRLLEPVGGLERGLLGAQLSIVPRLSAAPGDFIDLDSDSYRSGPIGLMHRFIKHIKLKPKPPPTSVKLSVLSTEVNEGGEVVGISEDVVTVTSKTEPGPKQRTALKKSLQLSVKATRNKLVAKKLQEHKFYEDEIYEPSKEEDGFDKESENNLEESGGLTDEENQSEDEEDEVEEEEEEEEDEGEEDMLDKVKENKRLKNAFIDEEAEESEDENCSSEEAEDVLENDISSKVRNRGLESRSILNKISCLGEKSLIGEESEDLLALCSGQFETQPISLSQLEDSHQEDEETPTVHKGLTQLFLNHTQHRKVIDSDEEESVSPNNQTKILKKLYFSDDEDSNSKMECVSNNDDDGNGVEEEEIDNDEEDPDLQEDDDETCNENENKFINDNSDVEISDNEDNTNKEVNYNSEEEIVEGKKFLDVEAELSGSEWGSADEDERGLSDFEADQADDEKINQRKLRTELERIHMREMLAEDKREVRLLQELLLEDGELHSDGPKRQRLYRWTNQDGFEKPKGLSDDELGADEGEDEEDIKWRQERLEREKYLLTCKQENKDEDESDVLPLPGIERKKKAPAQIKANQHDLSQASPDPKHPFKLLTHRGSFLSRGDKVLSRLAGLVQTSEPSGATRVKRNMVFAVVSPPKQEPVEDPVQKTEKRKAKEDFPKASKKLKFDTQPTKKQLSLFDRLKEFDALA